MQVFKNKIIFPSALDNTVEYCILVLEAKIMNNTIKQLKQALRKAKSIYTIIALLEELNKESK